MTTRKWVRPSADGILEAAERVLTENGYGETSLRQVMTAAGVSTTAFYARFASKEDVLRALLSRLLEQLASRARAELAAAEGLEEGFERGVDVLFEVLAPKRALVRLALTEGATSAASREGLGALYASLASLLEHQIRALSRGKSAASVDPSAVAWGIVGALNMQVLRWAVYDQLSTKELRAKLHQSARALLPVLKPVSKARRPRARAAS